MTVYKRVYKWVTDYSEQQVPESISEDAYRETPRNFVLNLLNGTSTKLAEQLASPDLVLVWLLSTLGAPVFFSGMLEPIRRGAASFPQLVVSGRMRGYAKRKWFWVGAGIFQSIALLIMLVTALLLTGVWAGVVIVLALLGFSIASGVGSVAFKDVLGKTIPENKRGQLLGLRSATGGGLTIAAGLVLYGEISGKSNIGLFVVLLGIAAALWALAAVLFWLIDEQPRETEAEQDTLSEARSGLKLLRQISGFKWFIASRGLLLAAELSVPYYALRAHQLTSAGKGFGLFIVSLGVAALMGSPIWGRVSDRVSNRAVMALGGVVGAVAAALALSFGLLPASVTSPALFAVVFLVVGLARAGVRVGRKSYIVNAAPDDERPLYTAAANTIAGVLMFVFIGFGAFAQVVGIGATLTALLILCLLGSASAWRMPKSDRMVQSDQGVSENE